MIRHRQDFVHRLVSAHHVYRAHLREYIVPVREYRDLLTEYMLFLREYRALLLHRLVSAHHVNRAHLREHMFFWEKI